MRCRAPIFHDRPLVVGLEKNEATISEQLAQCGIEADLILEPEKRNSCAAVAMACLHVMESAGSEKPDHLLIQACDHWIDPVDAFVRTIHSALPCAEHRLITFGITPDGLETGYGYILPGGPLDVSANTDCLSVSAFIEKPDQLRCRELIEEGGFWNSGIFLVDPALFLRELAGLRPDLLESVKEAFFASENRSGRRTFEARDYKWIESISVDHAVLQYSRKTAVLPVSYRWRDLGSWEAIEKLFSDSELMGMQFNPGGSAEDGVENGFAEARSNAENRPWGCFERLARGDGFQVKRLQIEPGQVLSLQAHHLRSEHWVIVSGSAEVTLGHTVRKANRDDAIHVPCGEVHRIANRSTVPLVLIEVQLGEYLGEDDIIRIEDVYNRQEHVVKK